MKKTKIKYTPEIFSKQQAIRLSGNAITFLCVDKRAKLRRKKTVCSNLCAKNVVKNQIEWKKNTHTHNFLLTELRKDGVIKKGANTYDRTHS